MNSPLTYLPAYLGRGMFWVKLGFGMAVAVLALWGVVRMARPGRPVGPAARAWLVPIVALWLLGVVALWLAASGHNAHPTVGQDANQCAQQRAHRVIAVAHGSSLASDWVVTPAPRLKAEASASISAMSMPTGQTAMHRPQPTHATAPKSRGA